MRKASNLKKAKNANKKTMVKASYDDLLRKIFLLIPSIYFMFVQSRQTFTFSSPI